MDKKLHFCPPVGLFLYGCRQQWQIKNAQYILPDAKWSIFMGKGKMGIFLVLIVFYLMLYVFTSSIQPSVN